MNWAAPIIAKLAEGEVVEFRPRGRSMAGLIEDGQLVAVEPLEDDRDLVVGDVVLVTVGPRTYLHLVKKTETDENERYLIGNNRGGVNGWVTREDVHGVLIRGSVQP